MKRALKIIGIVVVAAIVVLVGGIALDKNGVENPVSDAANTATVGAANAALDASGIKERIDDALHENAGEIASRTGLPETMVNGMIDGLDVPSWKVTTLPGDVQQTGATDISYGGYDATITTYDDPSVITVDTDQGNLTLEVPKSAQGYIQYLQYL